MVRVGLKKTSSERNTPETSKINKIQINLPFLTGKSQVNHFSIRCIYFCAQHDQQNGWTP